MVRFPFERDRRIARRCEGIEIDAAKSGFDQEISSTLPFEAHSMTELLARVGKYLPVVIFNGKSTCNGTNGIAGSIIGFDGKTLQLREMSTRLDWLPDLREIYIDDIKYVLFGSNYKEEPSMAGTLMDKLAECRQMLASIRSGNDQISNERDQTGER